MTHKDQSSNSMLLIIKHDSNHQSLVVKYLIQNKIIKTKNQTNLLWFNREEETLKVEVVRKLINQTSYGAYSDKGQICIILQADKGSIAAQNALLKIIEEPPINTKIILSANNLQQLLPTIKSRCIISHLNSNDETKVNPSIEKLAYQWIKMLDQTGQMTYSDIVDLAGKPSREEALSILKYILNDLKKRKDQNRINPQIMTKLLEAYHQLGQNFNVKLTLENCFFAIKAI
ncbi:MAG: hypothetical protein U9O78_02735 [Patescibacteria group bacterium]|nr:hypothetical protein [Patescibacteria group bacterium]